MDSNDVAARLNALEGLDINLAGKDFLLTTQKTRAELEAVLLVAELLEILHRQNISTRVFDSGLGISIFRDQSTRTRFSFASATSLLGLTLSELDEKKSQVAHGETVRETANMISFLTEVIGIRDDMFIGKGHTYMKEVGDALDDGFARGVLHQRPNVVNLQCDIDHPTQSMADLAHLKATFGSLEALAGKRIAMTWAYSPSYGKPLSVPQGIITLMTRFGMDVALAYPEGYDLLPETLEQARAGAAASGGRFTVSHSMAKAFKGADIVYPKSWAPFAVMERRTKLLEQKDDAGLVALEKECLAQNARYKGWECTGAMMKHTRRGKALYMHCLPADITGVSCKAGEVSAAVFEKYRIPTYQEASWKPFVIAAMILTSRFRDPAAVLAHLGCKAGARRGFL
ncbi:MAG: knotted carbamoyltransferase YgeW [Polyangia bacterium]|nr:knotted carbamoyltransferase YgeW [Polyangia bacterium]